MESSRHPLSGIALDFLSTPGRLLFQCGHKVFINICVIATSTDVEWAFSKGGLTVSRMRHSLADESIRAACVLGSWCEFPGAIPREDIITLFKDKSKRVGKQRVSDGAENMEIDIE